MKVIEISKGYAAIVDDEDFEYLAQWRWSFSGNGYAVRRVRVGPRKQNKGKMILMHREVLKTPDGMETDHINGNKLDNRRCNLRAATPSQNRFNTGLPSHNTSGIKGVGLVHSGRYSAKIIVEGKFFWLGVFDTPEEAKAARDAAALKHHKEFVRIT